MAVLPFFENTQIHKEKSIKDKEVAEALKTDLDQLLVNIQKLPDLTKLALNFIGVNSAILNSKKIMDNIVTGNNVDHNLDELRKNMNNLMNILTKNKQFDSTIKSFLGEDYFSKFQVVCYIVNKS